MRVNIIFTVWPPFHEIIYFVRQGIKKWKLILTRDKKREILTNGNETWSLRFSALVGLILCCCTVFLIIGVKAA